MTGQEVAYVVYAIWAGVALLIVWAWRKGCL